MRWFILTLTVLLCAAANGVQAAMADIAPRIPALSWEQRSDWLNVQAFGAKGDGIADDTAAIQQAFDRMSDGDKLNGGKQGLIVYFPAGHYRITRTLAIVQSTGGWIVGHGRDTVLSWDGDDNGVMYLSNGATYTRYEGITWDGCGKASVGVKHESQSYYETSIRYEHCAFLNCKAHGFLNGTGKAANAAAEIWFRNCLFSKCGAGVSLLAFNDYDNTFDGCEFADCGIGINSVNGNFYVRACHFARSTQVDACQMRASHASSLRLCTSQGSRRFFITGAGMHQSMKIQDCRIEGWMAPDGAIQLGQRGPTTIFDCVFTNPPNTAAPIHLVNPPDIQQLLVIGNCSSAKTKTLVDAGGNSRISIIPAGKRKPCLTSASQRFLRDTAPAMRKVLDAKRDFGAKADGATDDTAALQRGIDAARAQGHGAVLYLPNGNYRLTRALQVTGTDYSICGAGFRTNINWDGAKDGEMLRVHQPKAIAIEHLALNGPKTVPHIHQTADAGPSSIFYDEVYTNGCDEASTGTIGLWCDHLPKGAVVRMGHFIGNIRLNDCGAASILCAIHFYSLQLDGATQPKTGIAGFMFHNDAGHDYALDVLDNQDVLVADFYSESNQHYLYCAGQQGQGAGRVTIGASKLCPLQDECITIRNYQGRIFIGGGDSYNQSHFGEALDIVHEGTRPVDFIMAGHAWWAVAPRLKFGPGMRYASVENLLMENKYPEYATKSLPNASTPTTNTALAAAFDDFRELAAAYMQAFFPRGN